MSSANLSLQEERGWQVATTSAEMSHGAHKPAPCAEMTSEHARLAKTGYVVWCAHTAPHALSLGAFQQPSTFNMKHDSCKRTIETFVIPTWHAQKGADLAHSRPPPPASRALQSHNVSSVAT